MKEDQQGSIGNSSSANNRTVYSTFYRVTIKLLAPLKVSRYWFIATLAKSEMVSFKPALSALLSVGMRYLQTAARSNAMNRGKASWTAEITAVFRATESIRPTQIRLLDDKYAVGFLRPSLRLAIKFRPLALFLLWLFIDRRFPGATITAVSRIRFIDDCLKNSIDEGVEQFVILGAGYDSRAYRFGELQSKPVFEVDHPNTQRCKKDKIFRIFDKLPDHVIYVPVDFEKDNFMSMLAESGFRKDLRTLFIWEAVSKYLSPEAVNEILNSVSGNSCKGSSIVFDYLFQSMVDGSCGSGFAKKALSFQNSKGEPFIFGLPEDNPERIVISKGFSSVRNYTSSTIKNMYFSQSARAEKLHHFWGVIHATV